MHDTRRRSSMIEIHNSNSSLITEDDKTKLLLAAKTPNIISKRRGSAVSVETLQSNSRRNSITTTTATFNTTATTTTTMIHATQMLIPLDTDDFIKFNPSSNTKKLHYPPPPPPLEFLEDDNDSHINNVRLNRTLSQLSRSNHHHLPIYNNEGVNCGKSKCKDDSSVHSRSLSQPIPYFSPQRPLILSANYDNLNQYKKRTILSSRKLTNFFGDKPPIDICVKEIEKEGLKAMLHSKIPLCYFLYSLLEEYSCENLVRYQKPLLQSLIIVIISILVFDYHYCKLSNDI